MKHYLVNDGKGGKKLVSEYERYPMLSFVETMSNFGKNMEYIAQSFTRALSEQKTVELRGLEDTIIENKIFRSKKKSKTN